MATDKPRFTITLPDAMFEQVTEYKERESISTQSKAIQKLVGMGLEVTASRQGKEQLNVAGLVPEDITIAHSYHSLDLFGKKATRAVIDAETERVKVQRTQSNNVISIDTIRWYVNGPAAGKGGFTDDYYEDIPRKPDMPRDADYCLNVVGDSMEPYLHDGQMIYVKRDAQIEPFCIGIWAYQGATYVKQYSPQLDGSIFLLSSNPERESFNLILSELAANDLYYCGKVLGFGKLPVPVYK